MTDMALFGPLEPVRNCFRIVGQADGGIDNLQAVACVALDSVRGESAFLSSCEA
jgi:hypothetical protein